MPCLLRLLRSRSASIHHAVHRLVATRTRVALVAAGATVALAFGVALAVSSDAGAGGADPAQANAGSAGASQTGPLFVHDPTMAKDQGAYYLFSTGDPAGILGNGNIQIRTSQNLRDWSYAGTVFATKPAWITDALGDIPNLWAPDISYFDGLWHLYYAGSSFGSNNSVIGLATTPTLDPRQSQLPLDRRWPGVPY